METRTTTPAIEGTGKFMLSDGMYVYFPGLALLVSGFTAQIPHSFEKFSCAASIRISDFNRFNNFRLLLLFFPNILQRPRKPPKRLPVIFAYRVFSIFTIKRYFCKGLLMFASIFDNLLTSAFLEPMVGE